MAMWNNQRVRKIFGSKDFTFETETRDQRRHGFPDMAKSSMKAQDGPMPYTWQMPWSRRWRAGMFFRKFPIFDFQHGAEVWNRIPLVKKYRLAIGFIQLDIRGVSSQLIFEGALKNWMFCIDMFDCQRRYPEVTTNQVYGLLVFALPGRLWDVSKVDLTPKIMEGAGTGGVAVWLKCRCASPWQGEPSNAAWSLGMTFLVVTVSNFHPSQVCLFVLLIQLIQIAIHARSWPVPSGYLT